MLARVQVEHEIDQRAFQSRAGAVQNREARAGDLRRALEIENAERRSQVDVILWCEIKFWLRAPAADLRIRRFVFADRYAFVGNVWQNLKEFAQPSLGAGSNFIGFRNPYLQFVGFRTGGDCLSTLAFLHQRTNLDAQRIALCLESIGLANRFSPLPVKVHKVSRKRSSWKTPFLKRFNYRLPIFPDVV